MATIFHVIAGYFFLLLVVRVLTRRPGAQMTLFEFVIVFFIGGVIILATVGDDKSLTNCTLAVMAVGLVHRTVAWVKIHHPALGRAIDGTPLVLMRRGAWQEDTLRGMRLAHEDVLAAARIKGIPDAKSIEYAVLERNGDISIFEKEDASAGK